MNKVIGVIPSRWASTRLPGKPLHLILGKPLIRWVVEGAIKCKDLSEVWVATDHEGIAKEAINAGAKVAMTDPALPSGTDRIWAAIKNVDCEIVVNIQGDEPLVQNEWIEKLVQPFSDVSINMSTLSFPLEESEVENKNSVKVIFNQNKEAIYFSRFPIPFSRDLALLKSENFLNLKTNPLNKTVQKHVGMYGFRKSFLKDFCNTEPALLEKSEALEQLRALYMGAKIKVTEIETPSFGVDTIEDVSRVEEYLMRRDSK